MSTGYPACGCKKCRGDKHGRDGSCRAPNVASTYIHNDTVPNSMRERIVADIETTARRALKGE